MMTDSVSETAPLDLPPDWLCGPVEIDVGCHKGIFVVEMARIFPEIKFLGVEWQRKRVERTRAKIERMELSNAQVIQGEGLETLRDRLPAGCAQVVHVSFPDPWPKRRHHVRRLVRQDFLRETWRVLAPGGSLRLMTDDEPYFVAMREAVAEFDGFSPIDWDDGRVYPETEFQRKFAAIAKPIHRLALRRCDSTSSE
ncbi:MAG TPA: tRNA (guanosine(46)-N7)-methyltransferase TrmB [Chthoniobacterales bacterium]